MKININDFKWTREPANFSVCEDKIEIITKPFTDLWQRTYYHFRNELTECKRLAPNGRNLICEFSLKFYIIL